MRDSKGNLCEKTTHPRRRPQISLPSRHFVAVKAARWQFRIASLTKGAVLLQRLRLCGLKRSGPELKNRKHIHAIAG
ncbi:hypothetical protein Q8A67_024596 [Cirrhinus molitorella]|uniref:Uncharacterized protein n=1 Tax=Cirrhinus molitorella TaxID=172907 RepID=A0AA88P4X3_9TELE|nr:hypothetical protein Q8A67_024596 [Cirrhinus molitorella]